MRMTLVMLAVLMMVPSLCDAEVTMFDNSSGQFTWTANGSIPTPNTLFDPTLPPDEQQSTSFNSRQLGYFAFLGGGSNFVGADGITTGASIAMARDLMPIIVFGPQPGQETSFRPATAFQSGQQVGPEANYENGGIVGYFNPNLGRHNFLGDQAFIGFRVTLDDGLPHYGWIELAYGNGFSADGSAITMYQPLRWAYETEPNTPITVPSAPGAALLLGAGAAAATRRRRDP